MGCRGSKENVSSNNGLLETIKDHKDSINCIAVSDDESLLVTGSEDGTIMMWSTKTPETECLGVFEGHQSYITCLTITDTFVISGSFDSTIRKWDMTTCECLVIYEGHSSRISKVITNGNVIFSTSYDKTAKVWDFDPDLNDDIKEKSFRTYKGHTKGVYPLIFIPVANYDDDDPLKFNLGDTLITGSADSTARSWSAETGLNLKVFKGHLGPVTCMAADPQGMTLYTGSGDNTIRSWNIKTAECQKLMIGHEGSIVTLKIDDRLLISGGQDGKTRCWVREFGDCARVLKGHTHSVVAIKPKNGIIYTASGDATVRAYDIKTGSFKQKFEGHEKAVTAIAVIEEKLFSCSLDGTLRVWSLETIK